MEFVEGKCSTALGLTLGLLLTLAVGFIAAPKADASGFNLSLSSFLNSRTLNMTDDEHYHWRIDGPQQVTKGQDKHNGICAIDNDGDFNGDGIDDMAVGFCSYDAGKKKDAGAVYIIYGRKDIQDSNFSHNEYSSNPVRHMQLGQEIASEDGVRFVGQAGSRLGTSIAFGNVYGDQTHDDLIAGAPDSSGGLLGICATGCKSGAAFVFRGGSSETRKSRDLSNGLPSDLGYGIYGFDKGGEFGNAVAAGDVNGDGKDDPIIGDVDHDSAGRSSTEGTEVKRKDANNCYGLDKFRCGAVYIVFGRSDPHNLTVVTNDTGGDLKKKQGRVNTKLSGGGTEKLDTCEDGGDCTVAYGWPESHLGFSLAAGDVNGDGRADIAVSAPTADPEGRQNAGLVHVFYGSNDTKRIDLDDPAFTNGSRGFVVRGSEELNYTGYSVALEDMDQDGAKDLIVGAPGAKNLSSTGERSGVVYAISSWVARSKGVVDLAKGREGAPMLIINGQDDGDDFGASVTASPDQSGDGVPEYLIGAGRASGADDDLLGGQDGVVYLINGAVQNMTVSSNGHQRSKVLDDEVDKMTGSRDQRFFGSIKGAHGCSVDLLEFLTKCSQQADHFGGFRSTQLSGGPGGLLLWLSLDTAPIAPAVMVAGLIASSEVGLYQGTQFVSAGGDNNGDGKPDLVAAAPGFNEGRGAVYIDLGTNVVYPRNIKYLEPRADGQSPTVSPVGLNGGGVKTYSIETNRQFEIKPTLAVSGDLPYQTESDGTISEVKVSGANLDVAGYVSFDDVMTVLNGGDPAVIIEAMGALATAVANYIDYRFKDVAGNYLYTGMVMFSPIDDTFIPKGVEFSLKTGIFSGKVDCSAAGYSTTMNVAVDSPTGSVVKQVRLRFVGPACAASVTTPTDDESDSGGSTTSSQVLTTGDPTTNSTDGGGTTNSTTNTGSTTYNVTNNYGKFTLTLTGVNRQSIRSGRIYVYAKCSDKCKLTAGGKLKKKSVGRLSRTGEGGQRKILVFRMPRALRKLALRQLKKGRVVKVKITVTAKNDADETITRSRTIRLKR